VGDNNTTDATLIKTNDYDIISNTHGMKVELRQHQAAKDRQDWKEDSSSSSMTHPQMRASMKKICVPKIPSVRRKRSCPRSEEREAEMSCPRSKNEKQRRLARNTPHSLDDAVPHYENKTKKRGCVNIGPVKCAVELPKEERLQLDVRQKAVVKPPLECQKFTE
jgi:hypothetical protein